MRAGDEFAAETVRSIRPTDGLHTRFLDQVLGRHASRDFERGTPIAWEIIG